MPGGEYTESELASLDMPMSEISKGMALGIAWAKGEAPSKERTAPEEVSDDEEEEDAADEALEEEEEDDDEAKEQSEDEAAEGVEEEDDDEDEPEEAPKTSAARSTSPKLPAPEPPATEIAELPMTAPPTLPPLPEGRHKDWASEMELGDEDVTSGAAQPAASSAPSSAERSKRRSQVLTVVPTGPSDTVAGGLFGHLVKEPLSASDGLVRNPTSYKIKDPQLEETSVVRQTAEQWTEIQQLKDQISGFLSWKADAMRRNAELSADLASLRIIINQQAARIKEFDDTSLAVIDQAQKIIQDVAPAHAAVLSKLEDAKTQTVASISAAPAVQQATTKATRTKQPVIPLW